MKHLKNNKSPGGDGIRAEQLKYGGDKVPEIITDILTDIASTGRYQNEIKEGILAPLQKPGKKYLKKTQRTFHLDTTQICGRYRLVFQQQRNTRT